MQEYVKSFTDACKKIEEDSLYTAQAHFIAAQKWYRKSLWLVVIPSLIAGLSGLIVAAGGAPWVAAFAAIGGFIPAISAWLGVEKDSIRHENAGKLFTALRHDAIMLREVFENAMPEDQSMKQLTNLHNKYLMLVQTQDLTDEKSFNKARDNIKNNIFIYDFERNQQPTS
jgi:hypothetical protein